jgi:DNA-binding transcriptional MerR regulator
MNEHISIGKAIKILGISLSTMYRWEKKKIIQASFRTIGLHRR